MKKEAMITIFISIIFACTIGFIGLYPTLFSDTLSREEFLISVLVSENSDRLTKSSLKMQEALLLQQNLTQNLLLSEILYPELNNIQLYYEIYLPSYNESIKLINEAKAIIFDYKNFSNSLSSLISNYEKKAISSIHVITASIIIILVFMYAVIIITLYATRKKKKEFCPSCSSSNIRVRTTKSPKYICDKCKNKFDKPDIKEK